MLSWVCPGRKTGRMNEKVLILYLILDLVRARLKQNAWQGGPAVLLLYLLVQMKEQTQGLKMVVFVHLDFL